MYIAIETSHALKLPRTGVEEACWQMIENLKTQTPADWRVVLLTNKLPSEKNMSVFTSPIGGHVYGHMYGHKFNELPLNWEWKILNWPLKKLWSQFALSYELFKNPPDVFFAPGQLIPFFLPKKIKVITFVHDSAFEAEPKSYTFLGKIYLKLMNRRIMARSNKIITSTEFNKNELIKYYGMAPDKIAVAPLAYDKNVFQQFNPAKRDPGMRDNLTKPYFISLGRLEEKKNSALIISAFNQVRAEGIDCQLVLVGKFGKLSTAVREALLNSPYKKDIIHPGYVKTEDLPGLVGGAIAFVFPSRYEGFGMPVLESMACGTPVIASDIPALREVGGEAVVYIKPEVAALAGAMVQMAKDITWREKHLLAGLEQAQRFSWGKTAEILAREIAKIA